MDANGETAQDLGVEDLVEEYEAAVAAAEAEARAAAREAKQMAELAAEKRREEAEWRERLDEVSSRCWYSRRFCNQPRNQPRTQPALPLPRPHSAHSPPPPPPPHSTRPPTRLG